MEYRINGFEQIKAFYSWVFNNAKERVTPQHISLYLFLINQNNRSNWVEWFKVPFDLGMAGACIGNKKTYYSCLNDLVLWELIEYEKGTNEYKAPLIKLVVLKSTSHDTANVPLPEPLLQPQGTTLPIPLPTHIYKLITDNLQLITDNEKEFCDLIKKLNDRKISVSINIPFNIFWDLYDKKVGNKEKIENKWNKLTNEDRTRIMEYVPKYKNATPDKKYRKNPDTFFNQKSWNDEIIGDKKTFAPMDKNMKLW